MKASEARELSKEASAKSKQQLAFILDQVRSAASEEGEYSMSFVLVADARTVSALLALGYKVQEDTYRNAHLLTVSWAEGGEGGVIRTGECLEQPRAVAVQATSALAGGSGVVPAGGLRSAYIEYERAGQESGRKIVEQAALAGGSGVVHSDAPRAMYIDAGLHPAIPSTLVVSRRYPSEDRRYYWCGFDDWTDDIQDARVRVLTADEAQSLLATFRRRPQLDSSPRFGVVNRVTLMDALL